VWHSSPLTPPCVQVPKHSPKRLVFSEINDSLEVKTEELELSQLQVALSSFQLASLHGTATDKHRAELCSALEASLTALKTPKAAARIDFEKPGGRLTWEASKAFAEGKGGRLLSLEEARAFMNSKALLPGEDQWCAVVGADGDRDWVQVGSSYHHAGKSHVQDCHHYPPWGNQADDTTYGTPTWNCAVLYATDGLSAARTFDDCIGKTFHSFPTGGSADNVVDTFTFEADPFATVGGGSGRNEYDLIDGVLVHKHHKQITAKLVDGDFVWSHGYTSRSSETPTKTAPAKVGETGKAAARGKDSRLNDTARNTNDTAQLRRLVDQGADLTSTNGAPWHHTALHQSAFHNRSGNVATLIELCREKGVLERVLSMPSTPCGRGATGIPLELARGGGHQECARLIEEAMQAETPATITVSEGAVGFSITGWEGYNARFNGDYVATGQTKNNRPVFSHQHTEGVGAGHDWCRVWYNEGFWRIGHFVWVHGDHNRCVAAICSEAKHPRQIQASSWWEHPGQACDQDHGYPDSFQAAQGAPHIVGGLKGATDASGMPAPVMPSTGVPGLDMRISTCVARATSRSSGTGRATPPSRSSKASVRRRATPQSRSATGSPASGMLH